MTCLFDIHKLWNHFPNIFFSVEEILENKSINKHVTYKFLRIIACRKKIRCENIFQQAGTEKIFSQNKYVTG